MNENFGLHVRYSTLKKYKENYESDLKDYFEKFQDDNETDFLEVDLFAHQEFLKYLETKGAVTNELDEGEINHRNVNNQKRIIAFIENKIDECSNTKAVTNPSTLKWHGTPLELTEIIKPLIELKILGAGLTQKEIFEKLRLFFEIENFNESDKIKEVKQRKEGTSFLYLLEKTWDNMKKK